MIRLIGTRCTDSNVFSRGVLIVRFLLGNSEIIVHYCVYSIQFSGIISYGTSELGIIGEILENSIVTLVEFFVLVVWH